MDRRVSHGDRMQRPRAGWRTWPASKWRKRTSAARRGTLGILGFMEQLNEVDIAGVEPMTSVTPMRPGGARTSSPTVAIRPRAPERTGRPRRLLYRAQGRGMTQLSCPDHRRGPPAASVRRNRCGRTHRGLPRRVRSRGGPQRRLRADPDLARRQAAAAASRFKAGEAPDLCGIPLRNQGFFLCRGRAQPGRVAHPRRIPAPLREHRHQSALGRGGGLHRQAQHGRIRHGKLERDLGLRPCGEPLAVRRQPRPHARRLVGGVGGGGGGRSLPRRDRDRHRRLDPPARCLHWHRRCQADLRSLLAVGNCRLCLFARPSRPDGQVGPRCRDHAEGHGRP